MNEKDIKTKKNLEDIKLLKIAEKMIQGFYEYGFITDDDISDKEKLLNRLDSFSFKSKKIEMILDKRSAILNQSKIFNENRLYDFSIIFYAMYFEHQINSIIDTIARRRKLSKKTKNEIIRNINMIGKYTWLLEILDLPKFNEAHKKIILKVAEMRNTYVHYKYNTDLMEKQNNGEEQLNSFISEILKAVNYIKRYESRVVYGKNKGKVIQTLTISNKLKKYNT